jgi:hypothetical protein
VGVFADSVPGERRLLDLAEVDGVLGEPFHEVEHHHFGAPEVFGFFQIRVEPVSGALAVSLIIVVTVEGELGEARVRFRC